MHNSVRVIGRTTAGLLLTVLAASPMKSQAVPSAGPPPSRAVVVTGGIGVLGNIVSTPPQATVRSNGVPEKQADVSLQLLDSLGTFEVDSTRATTNASGVATFSMLRVRATRAYPSKIKLRMAVNVAGEPVPDTFVELTILPPPKISIELLQAPKVVSLFSPFTVEAAIRAQVGTESIPVVGASLLLHLPDGETASATSVFDGTATFAAVMIQKGRPGTVMLRVSNLASGVFSAPLTMPLAAGPITSIAFANGSDSKITVGKPFTLTLLAHDSIGNPLNERVALKPDQSGGELSVETATTLNGTVTWNGTYIGPSGALQIIARSGDVAARWSLVAEPSRPTQLNVIEDVGGRFVADSMLDKALLVRVQDLAGNGVPGAHVRIAVCRLPDAKDTIVAPDTLTPRKTTFVARLADNKQTDCTDRSDAIGSPDRQTPFIRGTQSRISDTAGFVRFDSLRIVGQTGRYRLKITAVECKCATMSGVMEYNADEAYDRSFAIISAIKSVAGTAPSGEFFDIRFQLRVKPWLHAFVHSDIPIARKSTTDTNVTSSQREIVDAEGMLNFSVPSAAVSDRLTDAPDRLPYLGLGLRIFNTVPYFVVHLGSVELAHSVFYGSSLNVGWARSLDTTPVKVGEEIFRPTAQNLLIEGFLRSSGVDFFKFLNIRASVMIPLGATGRRPTSRVVIAVPIGGLIKF